MIRTRMNAKLGAVGPKWTLCVLAILALGASIFWWCGGQLAKQDTIRSEMKATEKLGLAALMDLPAESLQTAEIARLNLACAEGLPGAEQLVLEHSLARLDEMAARVRTETERHYYRFQRNPAEFENSEGFFRMLMLAVVLAEDFHVQYAPNKIGSAANAHPGDGFFADAHDVFLHGLTGTNPRGTCSSLPVLQVAIGRRLGYPLKLVTTKGHLFVRWEDAPENAPHPSAGQHLHEPRSGGRESAPSSQTESQSRLTSAATVQGFNAQILPGILSRPDEERPIEPPSGS